MLQLDPDKDDRLLNRLIREAGDLKKSFELEALIEQPGQISPLAALADGHDPHFTGDSNRRAFSRYINIIYGLSADLRNRVVVEICDAWGITAGTLERYGNGSACPAHQLVAPLVDSIAQIAILAQMDRSGGAA